MEIVANLILGHLIADFPLQTSTIFRWKMKNYTGVLLHSAIHLCVNLLLFLPSIGKVWPALVGLFLLHAVQDQVKVRVGGENINTPAPFFLDQIFHFITLIGAAFLPPLHGSQAWLSAAEAFLAAGIIGATFVSTILIYTLAQSRPREPHDLGITFNRLIIDALAMGLMFLAVYSDLYWIAALILFFKYLLWNFDVGGKYYSAALELGVSPIWAVLIGLLVRQSL